MRKLFEMGLDNIREIVEKMGKMSIESLVKAKEATEGKYNSAFEISQKLKEMRKELLDIATELLVRYSPVARDLRFIQSAIDVGYDLYRISRYSLEIERTSKIVNIDKPDADIKKAFDIVLRAVDIAVDSFVNSDESNVGQVFELDNEMDELYLKSLEELKREDDGCKTAKALLLRHLERIGDHAKEIAERVVYLVEGKRIV